MPITWQELVYWSEYGTITYTLHSCVAPISGCGCHGSVWWTQACGLLAIPLELHCIRTPCPEARQFDGGSCADEGGVVTRTVEIFGWISKGLRDLERLGGPGRG